MAMAIHGADGARHLLSRRVPTLCALLATVCLGACGDPVGEGERYGNDADASTAPATSGAGPGAAARAPADSALASAARRPDAPAPAVRRAGWPDDFGAHEDASLEVREFLAVLRDERGVVWGLRQRAVRLEVPDGSDAPDAVATGQSGGRPGGRPGGRSEGQSDGQSDGGRSDGRGVSPWRYDAVVRLDGTLERAGGERREWSAIERAAVGLAGAPDAPGAGLQVLGDGIASLGALPAAGCRVGWRASIRDIATVAGRSDDCPRADANAAALGGLASATFGGFAVTGELLDAVPVRGVAWQRLAWGEPPPGGLGGSGAVVFDRAVLSLAGAGSVELVRSKRASGRGVPRTTLAALDGATADAGALAGIEVEWSLPRDDGDGSGEGEGERSESGGTADARDAGRLRVPPLGIDVRLRALSPVAATDDGLERVFRGAVIASGTHAGAGFIETRPLP